ncbi:MAG: zinc ribbon domain-containing protein, partial [Promethearchaeota archaeon]
VRLARGNEVLASQVFKDKTGDNPPNANQIVAWVLQTLPIPNINPYQISKSVGFIRQEAIRRNEEAKKKPVASLKAAKEVQLENVPQEVIERRDKKTQVGWVKEERAEEKKETKAAAASQAASAGDGSASKKKRKLASIPMSGGAASASSSSEGIKCSHCGNVIRFCPYCGKPLSEHK